MVACTREALRRSPERAIAAELMAQSLQESSPILDPSVLGKGTIGKPPQSSAASVRAYLKVCVSFPCILSLEHASTVTKEGLIQGSI